MYIGVHVRIYSSSTYIGCGIKRIACRYTYKRLKAIIVLDKVISYDLCERNKVRSVTGSIVKKKKKKETLKIPRKRLYSRYRR